MFNPSLILLIIISTLAFFLGIFVLLKNPKARLNISFALLSLANLVWINASYFEDEFRNPKWMYLFLKIDYSSGIIFAFMILLFCLNLTKIKILNNQYLHSFVILIPILFTVLLFFTKLILSGYEITSISSITPIFGNFEYFFDAILILTLSLSIFLMIRGYVSSKKEDRSQYIYLSVGFSIFIVFVLLTNVILSNFLKNSANYKFYTRLGTFSAILVPLFSGYSIIKHKLFNIKTISAEILSLGILLASLTQVLFAKNIYELTIGLAIFFILLAFVIMLIRSIENEVKRKEQLQALSDKLAIANSKLRQLDKAKSEFISIASHQLRTPLTAIKGFVSLLLEGTYGQVPETQKVALEKVYISNERLVQLVEDLLNISRIESGRMEFDFQEAQIEDLVTEAVNTLDLSAKNKGLYLEWKKPDKMSPKIKIDITKVKEVVSNMIDNAIKYTPKGGVTVRTENGVFFDHNTMERKNVLRVIVSDTGIGMEKEDIENIFDKFVRGKEISHYHTDGTGLGMFIAKKVTEAHQGKIWAESAGKEKGSRFILELPIG